MTLPPICPSTFCEARGLMIDGMADLRAGRITMGRAQELAAAMKRLNDEVSKDLTQGEPK